MKCPVCEHDMQNPVGNIYTCEDCDYMATDHELERVRKLTKSSVRNTGA